MAVLSMRATTWCGHCLPLTRLERNLPEVPQVGAPVLQLRASDDLGLGVCQSRVERMNHHGLRPAMTLLAKRMGLVAL